MPSKTAAEIEADIDGALRRCGLSAAGLWRLVRYLIEHQSDRKPLLWLSGTPVSTDQLASLAGCSVEKASRLLSKLSDVGLVETAAVDGRPAIHSPLLTRLMEVRAGARERKQRQRDREKSRKGVTSRRKGVTSARCHTDVTPEPPPPPSFPPTTPLTTPTTPDPVPTEPAAGGAPARGTGSRVRVPTPAQRAMASWELKWSVRHHGAEYGPGKVDWVKMAEALAKLKVSEDPERALARFDKVADTFLRQPEQFGMQGHRLASLVQHWPFIVSETVKAEKGISDANGKRKPSAAERGEYPEPDPAAVAVPGTRRGVAPPAAARVG